MQFNRPVPGQSLTSTPKGAPYERPPEINDPVKALDYHLDILDNPKAVEQAMFMLEMGVDLSTLVEGITRNAVIEGMHSIDISLIVAPVIHEYLKGYADSLDINYDEGFEDKEQDERISYARNEALALKFLSERKADFDYDEEAGLSKQEGMNFFGPDGRIRDNYIPKPEYKGKMIDTDSPDYERMLKDDPVREASVEKPQGLMART